MKRRELLLAAAGCACGGEGAPRPFAEAALAAAHEATPLAGSAQLLYWRELGRLTALARSADSNGASLASRLSALIFDSRGFVREVDDSDLRFTLLPNVLRDRRGGCVGLGSLYLALAEALGLTAHGVLRPGHFYVRLDEGGGHTNLELLRRGEVMPDSWYESRFPAPRGAVGEYGRPLTLDETVGVILFNVGNQRRREHRLEAARSAYARAVRLFPAFAEAHASLGAALHLLGRFDEAQRSYQAAQRLSPQLPNLDLNLRLLEGERAP